ncbi:MAG: ribonuclease Z [Candidatus Neomarinimicrobiota bacterium]
MKLTILGSGNFVPVKNRSNPGYLLDVGKETIMLDCGSGSLRQLARVNRSLWELRRVFFSHIHLDHIADFVPLLFTRKYLQSDFPIQNLAFYAHPNFETFYRELTRLFSRWIEDERYSFNFQPLEPGGREFDEYSLQIFPTTHTLESLILKFTENGKTFVYTGDTDLSETLVTSCRNADCVLTELSSTDNQSSEGHLCPSKIIDLIRLAQPKQILLTHVSPQNDDPKVSDRIQSAASVPVQIVNDLDTFEI